MSPPPHRFIPSPIPKSGQKQLLLLEVIQHLLSIRVIEPVPSHRCLWGVYSILFIIPKKLSDWRAILNLKGLYLWVKKQVLHGVPPFYPPDCTAECFFSNVPGPQGSSPTHPQPPVFQTLPEFLVPVSTFPIQSLIIWPFVFFESLHQDSCDTDSCPEATSDLHLTLIWTMS